MENIELYRQSASECLALAKRSADPDDRTLLIAMATRWLHLARAEHRHSEREHPLKMRSREVH